MASRHVGALALVGALLNLSACEPKADDDTGESGDASTGDGTSGGDSLSSTSEATNATSGGSGITGGSDSSTGDVSTGTSGMTTAATTGDSSTGTTTGDSSTGVTTGDVDPPGPCVGEGAAIEGLATSMAYLKSQVPPDMTSGSGSSGSSSGGEVDPSTLYIRLADESFSCQDPNDIVHCGAHWDLTIVIPPEFQSPGTYTLGPDNVIGLFTETGPDEGGNTCGFGGGTFAATFELIAIDESVVEGRLCNVDKPWLWPDPEPNLEGLFYADRCP